jgi:hypothetical protein
MLGKPFAGPPCLGTVRKGAVNAQHAIDGQDVHRIISSKWFKPLEKVRLVAPYRSENNPSVDAILGAQSVKNR